MSEHYLNEIRDKERGVERAECSCGWRSAEWAATGNYPVVTFLGLAGVAAAAHMSTVRHIEAGEL
jgi:hypothetical protein